MAKGGGGGDFGPLVALGCGTFMLGIVFSIIFFFTGLAGGKIDTNTDTTAAASTWAGSVDTVTPLGGATMPATSGKIGHEQHFGYSTCFASGQSHKTNSYSAPLASVPGGGCGAFGGGKTSDQEMWYFNMRWDTGSGYPNNVKHKKVIISANGKRVVASIEEYGPAAFLWTRNGINSGASPEVYNYLGLGDPYKKPGDKNGYANFAFAKDQSIPLGPLN